MWRILLTLAAAVLMTGTGTAQVRIELVLDCSGQMSEELEDGQTRMAAARTAIGTWIREQGQRTLSGLGLTAVGGDEESPDDESCGQVRSLIEPGSTDLEAWIAALEGSRPSGPRALIRAVIAASEKMAVEGDGAALIVITSGENECEVDGRDAAAPLAGGLDLKVIGIGLADEAVDRFTAVAPTRNAADVESLLQALRSTGDDLMGDMVVLEVPSEVPLGRPFEVVWEGPAGEADFLSIASPDSETSLYLDLHLAEAGSPATLAAPSVPGAYEVRYVNGRTGRALRRQAVEVTEAPVAITAPAVVNAGSRFELSWTGPDAADDFIAIAPKGSPTRRHLDWIYTTMGSPTTLAAPFRPGRFEIRYVSGATREVLVARPLKVVR